MSEDETLKKLYDPNHGLKKKLGYIRDKVNFYMRESQKQDLVDVGDIGGDDHEYERLDG